MGGRDVAPLGADMLHISRGPWGSTVCGGTESMKIHVNHIPEQGLQEHATYAPAALDLAREDIHLQEPLAVDAFITAVDRELIVKAQIAAPLRLVCGRCLDEFLWTLEASAVFTYKVRPTDVVDVTEDVRQEVLLGYPMIPRCSEACKGLCPACGVNWNHGTCPHAAGGTPGLSPRHRGAEEDAEPTTQA